jgi:flagellin
VSANAGNANNITAIDAAISAVNTSRAKLGAVQSRFENTISFLRSAVEQQAAAKGRIMDADFAAETANLSRTQILQQAGTAMIAQANQVPQNVLSLLKG